MANGRHNETQNKKNVIYPPQFELTDFDEIWHVDANWRCKTNQT